MSIEVGPALSSVPRSLPDYARLKTLPLDTVSDSDESFVSYDVIQVRKSSKDSFVVFRSDGLRPRKPAFKRRQQNRTRKDSDQSVDKSYGEALAEFRELKQTLRELRASLLARADRDSDSLPSSVPSTPTKHTSLPIMISAERRATNPFIARKLAKQLDDPHMRPQLPQMPILSTPLILSQSSSRESSRERLPPPKVKNIIVTPPTPDRKQSIVSERLDVDAESFAKNIEAAHKRNRSMVKSVSGLEFSDPFSTDVVGMGVPPSASPRKLVHDVPHEDDSASLRPNLERVLTDTTESDVTDVSSDHSDVVKPLTPLAEASGPSVEVMKRTGFTAWRQGSLEGYGPPPLVLQSRRASRTTPPSSGKRSSKSSPSDRGSLFYDVGSSQREAYC